MTSLTKKALLTIKNEGVDVFSKKAVRFILGHIPRKGTPYYYKYIAQRNWQCSGDFYFRPKMFKLVYLDPNDVEFVSKNRFGYRNSMFGSVGLVAGGSWDQNTIKFQEKPEFKAFKAHFTENVPWEETDIYKHMVERIESGKISVRYQSKKDVCDRFYQYDKLYTAIQQEGYKSKRELYSSLVNDPMSTKPKTNPQRFKYLNDEVVVNIGRDGEFLFCGGHHRLCIAQLLNIDSIPVRVMVRHEKWQMHRDERKKEHEQNQQNLIAESLHPDLRQILQ